MFGTISLFVNLPLCLDLSRFMSLSLSSYVFISFVICLPQFCFVFIKQEETRTRHADVVKKLEDGHRTKEVLFFLIYGECEALAFFLSCLLSLSLGLSRSIPDSLSLCLPTGRHAQKARWLSKEAVRCA